MDFALDPNARSPLYRQIQDQIRYAISVGDLVPGDSLPSIRDLEERLDVNRNTVRRAYLELQLDGTLIVRQGREAVVAERQVTTHVDPHELDEAAESLTAMMIQRAESMGIDSVLLADYVMRAAQEHDDTQVDIGATHTAAVASERHVEVVAQPSGERDMPSTPEVGDRLGAVGRVEVAQELEAEHQSEADRHVGVAREIEIDLKGVGDDSDPGNVPHRSVCGEHSVGDRSAKKSFRLSANPRMDCYEPNCICRCHDYWRQHGNILGKYDL